MTRSACRLAGCLLVAALTIVPATIVAADDSLPLARDLYAQAAYEDALAMLNRLRTPEGAAAQDRAIEQYRAMCLLALGRSDEAQRAIEVVITAEPTFHPSDADVSPRVRSAFTDVRRRMLPTIVQQKYVLAKAAFDRKEFAEAAQAFSEVVGMLGDPDLGTAADQPPLADLRTLATGFRELSVSSVPPPPPPPPADPLPDPPANPRPLSTEPPALRIYGADDGNVVPPSVLRQSLPAFSSKMLAGKQGAIAVVVNESGAVESAMMLVSLGPAYDKTVLQAARAWQYAPAKLDGVPVKFRRVVQINLGPVQ